jgi:uncharacterized small protein (DUF1192 family)
LGQIFANPWLTITALPALLDPDPIQLSQIRGLDSSWRLIFSENRPPAPIKSGRAFRDHAPICYGARGRSTDDGVQRLIEENTMSNGSTLSLPEIEDRIAILRDNIRQLIEQAAGSSGAEDEARNADRIAQQTEELEKLNKQRDAMLKKK